ncbi:MAG: signal peptidase I [Planctomycetota bacterium]|nr:MAG: signal peptidase I [Planctomycetota bacterium]
MLVRDLPPFTGDRILVNKFPYEFTEPKRWDVVVFKYPEEPQTNYIKRLVGLPNETILIERGDVFLVGADGERRILRKRDPNKQRRLQILVYDDDHREQRLIEAGWPRRWAPMRRSDDGTGVAGWLRDPNGWEVDETAYRLTSDVAAAARITGEDVPERVVPEHWLRYRHIVPTERDWEAVTRDSGRRQLRANPQPQLIGDFCGYNAVTGTGGMGVVGSRSLGEAYWVGDLTISFEVDLQQAGADGFLLIELNEGVRKYRCRLFPESGRVVLSYADNLSRFDDEVPLDAAVQPYPLHGVHRICFANVDQRLSVWIDDELVPLKNGGIYELPATLNPSPQPEDLVPVGISGFDIACEISHLLLERDIYYRSEHLPDRQAYFSDAQGVPESNDEDRLYELLSSPYDWYAAYAETMRPALFELGPDEYLMLGDNSPRSRDSRLWPNVRDAEHRHAVKRRALVGKAFFVYWPHGTPFLNGGYGYPVRYHKTLLGGRIVKTDYASFRIPFYPTVWRMRRIR